MPAGQVVHIAESERVVLELEGRLARGLQLRFELCCCLGLELAAPLVQAALLLQRGLVQLLGVGSLAVSVAGTIFVGVFAQSGLDLCRGLVAGSMGILSRREGCI